MAAPEEFKAFIRDAQARGVDPQKAADYWFSKQRQPAASVPSYLKQTPDMLNRQMQRELVESYSPLEKAAIGFADPFVSMAKGAQQIYTGAFGTPEEADALEKEEAQRRALLAPMLETGEAQAGSLLGNIGAFAVPGGQIARGAQALKGAPGIAALIAGEGALGAGGGALAAMAPGESRAENAMLGGTLGAALPAGGALLRSSGARGLSKGLLDLVPVVGSKRVAARNAAADAKSASDKLAAKEAQNLALRQAQEKIAKLAGLPTAPRDQTQMARMLDAIGKDIGSLAEGATLQPVSETLRGTLKKSSDELVKAERRQFKPVLELLEEAEAGGALPGSVYAAARKKLGDLMIGQASPAKKQIARALRNQLDDAFDASVAPETAAAMREARKKYNVSQKLSTLNIKPGEGFSPDAARSKLDRSYIPQDVKQGVQSIVEALPKKAATVERPTKEAANETAAWVSSIGSGGALPVAQLTIPPAVKLAELVGNSPKSRAALAALLRGGVQEQVQQEEPPPLYITRGR